MSLSLQRQAMSTLADSERDISYLIRNYQWYTSFLRERIDASPDSKEETNPVLLTLLSEVLALAQQSNVLASGMVP